jgi:protein SCO1/2
LIRFLACVGAVFALLVGPCSPLVLAQRSPVGDAGPGYGAAQGTPADLQGVNIDEKPGAQVPADLTFIDENGQTVRLGDLFDGQRPVVLNIGYYGCPMLCGLVMRGMLDSLQEMHYTPGEEFRVVSVSIDPTETHELAKVKKQSFIDLYGRPEAAAGWHFLTGEKQNITQLTEAVGFNYRWIASQEQYAHAAAIIVLTPDGKVSRYLYGIKYDPKTVRLSLVEASQGKVGSTVDQFLLYCFHYDPTSGAYTVAAMNVMRLGGVLMIVVLGTMIGGLFMFERRQKKSCSPGGAAEPQRVDA